MARSHPFPLTPLFKAEAARDAIATVLVRVVSPTAILNQLYIFLPVLLSSGFD
ncbi:hypothetical protein H6F50_12415 [Coleofasciculus sp. FACHB-712]|uniref:hypothetical protein n=1 Tax=Coleofasciculus sp. FACHB-712 TaxID=2692789 RepID=UPI001684A156|nr:hypothetical protein [Coleofasciculus sp. FACHB-712]MBD1943158.1 hypothetical protein [Coleofasciculus sp. FACHB-712]